MLQACFRKRMSGGEPHGGQHCLFLREGEDKTNEEKEGKESSGGGKWRGLVAAAAAVATVRVIITTCCCTVARPTIELREQRRIDG